MSDMPEAARGKWVNGAYQLPAARHDAPLTPAEAMARCPEAAALVALLYEARSDLESYVDAEYPPKTCKQYPDIARRHHRDMDLCRRIDAALAPFTKGSDG